MKKKIWIFLAAIICLFGIIYYDFKEIKLENIKVQYKEVNADGKYTPSEYSGNPCGVASYYCEAYGESKFQVLATLYYFNADGTREKLGTPILVSTKLNMTTMYLQQNNYDAYAKAARNYCANGKCNVTGAYDNDFLLNFGLKFNNKTFKTVSLAEYKEYFRQNYRAWLRLMGFYDIDSDPRLQRPSQTACNGCNATYGYRLIIEPILEYMHNGEKTFFTPIEAAKNGYSASNPTYWPKWANYFNTEFVDVGISPGPYVSSQSEAISVLSNDYLGNGMHIIDFMPQVQTYSCSDGTKQTEMTACVKSWLNQNGNTSFQEYMAMTECEKQYCNTPIQAGKCWGEVVTEGNPAVCTYSNSNNTGTFNEKYVKNCKNTANKYGKPEDYLVDGTCRFYCLETASQSFPGNVANALSKGTILVWPTSNINTISLSKNIYPVVFSGSRTCTLVMDGSDDDIYEKESPIDRYNKYYDYVIANWYKRETTSSVWNSYVASFRHVSLSWEEIRNSYNKQWALSEDSCNAYYAEVLNKLNSSLDSAYNTRSSWVSAHPASTNTCHRMESETPHSCTVNGKATTCCYNTNCQYSVSRDCTDGDYPHNDEISALENVKNNIANDLNSCKAYVDNYVGMAGTYVQVASCNNKFIDSKSIYNFQTNASMSFEGADGIENVVLQIESENYSCINCKQNNQLSTKEVDTKNLYFFTTYYNKTNFANLVNSINAGGSKERVVTASANVTYTLPSGSITEDKKNGNYTQTNYNGFKISKNSLIGIKYDLKLFNTQLGHNNSFGSLLNKNGVYTCNYEVTETPTDECICPPGTSHEGEDLYCLVADGNTSCIEAKIKYCNDESIYIPEECPGLLTCPSDPTKSLSACVNSGYDYNYCENLICKSNISNTYRCKNTNGVGGKMDITSCVYTKMAQGLSEQSAIDECDSIICPISGGLRIIYRTISLENPFPGKTISGGVSGFNTDVKGRYPGTNWNSVNVVKNEILYSRTHSQSSYGSKIYQNETPLYTFVLNSTTINAIRSYNDTHKYDDFELDCKKNNATACVSTFVHDSNLSGLVGGTCQYNTSKTNFYKCSDDA